MVDDVPEPLAFEVGGGEVFVEVAIVPLQVLADGVGDDFVHVDGDALAGWMRRLGQRPPRTIWAAMDSCLTGSARWLPLWGAACGASRAGSYQRRRPQESQVMISVESRSRRSFHFCGRSSIWQAVHFCSQASADAGAFRFRDAVVERQGFFADELAARDAGGFGGGEGGFVGGEGEGGAVALGGVELLGLGDGFVGQFFLGVELFGALHGFELGVFEFRNFGLVEGDFVLPGGDLYGGGGGFELLAQTRDFCLAVLDVGLERAALHVFFGTERDDEGALAEGGFGLAVEFGDAPGQGEHLCRAGVWLRGRASGGP